MTKGKGGRPSLYSKDIAVEICTRLACGEPLVTMCEDEHMPGVSSVYRWLADNEEFRDLYSRAREDQAHTLADEIIKIADTPVIGTKTKINEKGERETTEGDMIEHRRLQVDSRKWYAAKMNKKYSEKVGVEHSGSIAFENMSEADILAELRALTQHLHATDSQTGS